MDRIACLCTNVRRAALALTSIYDEALAPHGLKVTQFSLLRAVERRGSSSLTSLASATGLDRSTLGRNLRLLEGAGLVRLSPGEDQRERAVSLTPEGTTRLHAAARTWRRLQDSLAASLGGEAERLVAAAERVTALARPGHGHGELR